VAASAYRTEPATRARSERIARMADRSS
jgi:hypothetical protein